MESRSNIWSDTEEEYLKLLHFQAFDAYNYWNDKSRLYRKYYNYINIPTIIISSLNGVFAVLLVEYIQQRYVSTINASLSIISSLISSLNSLLKINDNYGKALVSAQKYYALHVRISKELNQNRVDRLLCGKDFLNQCVSEYTEIFEKSEPMYLSFQEKELLKNRLLMRDDESINNNTKRFSLISKIGGRLESYFTNRKSDVSTTPWSAYTNMMPPQESKINMKSNYNNKPINKSIIKPINNPIYNPKNDSTDNLKELNIVSDTEQSRSDLIKNFNASQI